MKTFSIIITIVAVLAIGAAGYFYWQKSEADKKVADMEESRAGLEKDLDNTKKELANTKDSFEGIKAYSAAFKAVVDTFVVAGDTQVETIGSTAATNARQKIGDIADNADKISAEKNWDDFYSSKKVTDFQALLRTLSSGIERNINNAVNKPEN